MPDLRAFTRIKRQLTVNVTADERTFAALTQNISLRGALLTCDTPLAVDQTCACEVVIDPDVPESWVRANAHVVRHTPEGVAVRFYEICGADSYTSLKQLLLYNAADPERVEEECDNQLGGPAARSSVQS